MHNRLSKPDRRRLIAFIKDNPELVRLYSRPEIAELASQQLGILITLGNINGLFHDRPSGRAVLSHQKLFQEASKALAPADPPPPTPVPAPPPPKTPAPPSPPSSAPKASKTSEHMIHISIEMVRLTKQVEVLQKAVQEAFETCCKETL